MYALHLSDMQPAATLLLRCGFKMEKKVKDWLLVLQMQQMVSHYSCCVQRNCIQMALDCKVWFHITAAAYRALTGRRLSNSGSF